LLCRISVKGREPPRREAALRHALLVPISRGCRREAFDEYTFDGDSERAEPDGGENPVDTRVATQREHTIIRSTQSNFLILSPIQYTGQGQQLLVTLASLFALLRLQVSSLQPGLQPDCAFMIDGRWSMVDVLVDGRSVETTCESKLLYL
jgi:hypothetical protein